MMSGASSKEDIVRSLGLTSRNFILLYPWHQILIASLPNVKLDPPDLVLACSQAPFIMADLEMIDLLSSVFEQLLLEVEYMICRQWISIYRDF
jgi:hypothetical protein